MPLANCPRCKKLFNKLPSVPICTECHQQEEEDFELCYEYLRDYPNTSVRDLSRATGVEYAQIMHFYQTGRLFPGDAGYPCERCGGPTHRGAYCQKCSGSLKSALGPSTGAGGFGGEDDDDDPGRRGLSRSR